MRNSTLSACLLAISAVLLLSPAVHAAQARQEADRVVAAVNTAQHQTISGHLPQWAAPSGDLGAVSTDLMLDHLTVVLARSAATQAAFEQFLDDQTNPASPLYQHWLTPQQVGEQFGLTDHDINAVTSWLTSQGLRVDAISPDRTRITFSGASSSVARALGTEFHTYNVMSHNAVVQRLSINHEPAVPAALAAVIKSFNGLSEVREEPQSISGTVSAPAHSQGSGTPSPELTATCTGNVPCYFLAPADFVTIFDIKPVYNAGITGTGVKVAVIGRSTVLASDITSFQTNTGLNASAQPVLVIPSTGSNPGIVSGDNGEQTLDVNRVMGTAPGAETDLVVSANSITTSALDVAAEWEVSSLVDPIETLSYGACEQAAGLSGVDFWSSLFSTAAAEGITTFVSSGDSAAAGCATAFSAPPSITPSRSINYICSSPYVTCVGGTELADTASPSTYWSSTNGTGYSSALSYIPEGAWNEPLNGVALEIAGSGGGSSIYVAKPSWQTGVGVPADGFRDTPDVSLPAAAHDGYYACLAGSCASGTSFTYFAGTSAAAPGMAGIMALVVQKLGKAQGNFNPTLYRLAATTSLGVFHDTTPASSGVSSCSVGTASMCNNSTPGISGLTGGLAGYALTTGFDLATGWGSVDVAKLIAAVVTPYVTPTVTVTATSSSIALGGTDSFTVTVAGTPGTPSGTVQFYDGSTALGSAINLSNAGTATLSSQTFSTGGTHNITAQYNGDTVFVATTSAIYTLAVSLPTPTVTLISSTASLLVGQAPTLTATVSGTSGTATGSVQFLANNVNFGSAVTLVGGVATLSTQSFTTAGSYSMTAQYSGNSTYGTATSSGTTIVVSASGSSPYYTLTPASGTLTISSPGAATGNTYSVMATSVNSYTGTVALTCLVAYTGSGTASDLPTCSLAPTSLTLAANATATSVATITTTAAHATRTGTTAKLALGAGGVLACLLVFLPLGARKGRRRLSLFLALLVLLAIGSGLSGCGGGGSTPAAPGDPGTTIGSYTVTVTGTVSSVSTPTTFTLTVN